MSAKSPLWSITAHSFLRAATPCAAWTEWLNLHSRQLSSWGNFWSSTCQQDPPQWGGGAGWAIWTQMQLYGLQEHKKAAICMLTCFKFTGGGFSKNASSTVVSKYGLASIWLLDKQLLVSHLQPLLNHGTGRHMAHGHIQNSHYFGCFLPQEEAESDDHMVIP